MFKTELKFGIVGGLAVGAYKYIEFLPGFQTIRLDTGVNIGLLAFLMIIVVIVFGVKYKRNHDYHTKITFREAFRTGMIIAILMAAIATPGMYLYAKFVNPQEGDYLIHYILSNRSPNDVPLSPLLIKDTYEYYAPSHRALHTGEDIILTGILVSLFSAGMFRRLHHDDLDLIKKKPLPSIIKKLFLVSVMVTFLPIIVYISWILKFENINSFLFDFLIDPINDVILQIGTAFFSLTALIINIIIFNRISLYSHHRKLWNVVMIIVCGGLFFISLVPIL